MSILKRKEVKQTDSFSSEPKKNVFSFFLPTLEKVKS